MYQPTLWLHSWLRWVVLALAVLAVIKAIGGIGARRAWGPADDAAGKWFTIGMDVQFLVGLLLYGLLSPITRLAFADMGAAMRDSALRFWAVEHFLVMVLALAFAHVGRARARRGTTDASRFRTAAVFYGLSLVAMLAAIPWPFMANARPLLRLE
ncbi:MAG: hypothetical protein KJ061_11225 [Vicinamibacteraceae bacterium]|nr:hypothetical protein [Vicinamibacteraceae bacterium]